MPPPGGFEAVKYKRNLPFRGPGGLAILGGVTAICGYGFYRLGKGNLEKRQVTSHSYAHIRYLGGQQVVERVQSRLLDVERGPLWIRPQYSCYQSVMNHLSARTKN
jgi:hypothetical protein